jgi:hypothetical protein
VPIERDGATSDRIRSAIASTASSRALGPFVCSLLVDGRATTAVCRGDGRLAVVGWRGAHAASRSSIR